MEVQLLSVCAFVMPFLTKSMCSDREMFAKVRTASFVEKHHRVIRQLFKYMVPPEGYNLLDVDLFVVTEAFLFYQCSVRLREERLIKIVSDVTMFFRLICRTISVGYRQNLSWVMKFRDAVKAFADEFSTRKVVINAEGQLMVFQK